MAITLLNFTFSAIFLVNNVHRAIKVHVNKVQYCRAGHRPERKLFVSDKSFFSPEVLIDIDI